MRSIAPFLFLLLLSCHTKDKQTETATWSVKPNALPAKTKRIINGNWVISDYIRDITKTKSPAASAGKLSYLSEIFIDTAGSWPDSMYITAAMGNHEGYQFLLYFKKGSLPTSFPTDMKGEDDPGSWYELGYTIGKKDTILTLYLFTNNKKLVSKANYTRMPDIISRDVAATGLQYVVNERLFTGHYREMDHDYEIEFCSDGKVKGFPGFDTYYVITDFVAETPPYVDNLCFNLQESTRKCYRFEINGDTLHLYNQPEEGDETDSAFSQLPILELIKTN